MITYHKSTDCLTEHLQYLEKRRAQLEKILSYIKDEQNLYFGKILMLDWQDANGALVTIYNSMLFKIEFCKELKDEWRPAYLAYHNGEFLDYFNTLSDAEKHLVRHAKKQLWKDRKK